MAISYIFWIFPSLRPSSQSALVRPNSLLFSPLPSECHLKTFPPCFHPCKPLTLKLHRGFSQPCKNTRMPHAIRSSLCSFFDLWPTLTGWNLSDQSLKVPIYHVWHLHLFVMILERKGVFPLFRHLDPCRPAVHTIALFFVVLEQVRSWETC